MVHETDIVDSEPGSSSRSGPGFNEQKLKNLQLKKTRRDIFSFFPQLNLDLQYG